MTEQERNRYLKAYYDNEADANRHMSFCNAIAAFVMFAILVLSGYLALYRLGMTGELLFRITEIFPVPVASVDSKDVRLRSVCIQPLLGRADNGVQRERGKQNFLSAKQIFDGVKASP